MTVPASISFWEKQHFFNYDFAVIGAGIVGLSTAIELKNKYPNANVIVFERGFLPTGASTKNAGFACFGSATEIHDDLQVMSEEEALQLVKLRWQGLQILRQRLGDNAIDFQSFGGFELISEKENYILDQLQYLNKLLKPVFSANVFSISDDKIKPFGFNTTHLIRNTFEGQIDTGKMMRSLISYALRKGVEIKNNAEVSDILDCKNNVKLNVNNSLQYTVKQVFICTNAFTKKLMPKVELYPGRGQVLVTKPIEGLKFKGVFHFDKGYFYFRNFGKRIIFGGGRNYFLAQETTETLETTANIINLLKEKLKTVILPGQPFQIDHTWSGIMAFGKTKQPILQQISNNVVLAVRLGGMGVAIGSKLGQMAVEEYT